MTATRPRIVVPASEGAVVIRAARALREFLRTEAAGGAVMLVGVLAALVWVNGPFGHSYHDLFEHHLHLSLGPVDIDKSVHHWINEGLMAIFFFVVGLEIKRELVDGELRDPRTAALPVIGAIGGMLVPALVYVLLNGMGGDAGRGWGVPVATDIAFAIGVLALLGHRVPAGLKIFLLTLAVADDIGGIVVIAVFYSTDVAPAWVGVALAAFVTIPVMRRMGITHPLSYVPVALVAWYSMVQAGVEPAIAGVVLGLMTPARSVGGRHVLHDLEHRIGPWSAFAIVPVFALANAGVELGGGVLGDAVREPVTWGITLGLVLGKTVGITAATLLAVRLGVGRLGPGIRPGHVVGCAMLGGVGFTVALFVASLAFAGHPELLEDAKIGVFIGSMVSAVAASTLLTLLHRRSGDVAPHPAFDPDAPADLDGDGWVDDEEVEAVLTAAADDLGRHGHHPRVG